LFFCLIPLPPFRTQAVDRDQDRGLFVVHRYGKRPGWALLTCVGRHCFLTFFW
jgi:hypothetical protein